MSSISRKGLVWFRRDLRLTDNTAVREALKSSQEVYCLFVFDSLILQSLSEDDQRVQFIWYSLIELREKIRSLGGELYVRWGSAVQEVKKIVLELGVDALYFSRDYEPYAVERDRKIESSILALNRKVYCFKDQVMIERSEIMTIKNTPFTVFTPYKKAWLKRVHQEGVPDKPDYNVLWKKLSKINLQGMPDLSKMGFLEGGLKGDLKCLPGESGARKALTSFIKKIEKYEENRNYPAIHATSFLSVHLRFGTVSIRDLYRLAISSQSRGGETWLNELIWRDFYFNIIHHFPFVVEKSFRPAYQNLKFENDKDYFRAWCRGQTGYPIVDAGMRQLNITGFMHNRLRMITASFLVKDLQIDWRWGERYFAEKLMDYDLAANNGGWQWAASTGCDAQPYFRIFNPTLQSKKFDRSGDFLRSYLPELGSVPDSHIHEPWLMSFQEQKEFSCQIGKDYPPPLVDHAQRRNSTLALFKKAREADKLNQDIQKP